MGKNTGISWCHHSFNTHWGCAKVSQGCAHCYADTATHRFGFDVFGFEPGGARKPLRTFGDAHWNEPRRWNRDAENRGVRERVFCNSMGDVFDEHPDAVHTRERLWQLIRDTPQLDWLLLTKRPHHIAGMLPDDWGEGGYANVWLGTSVEGPEVVHRVRTLRAVPARVRFLSIEPLLSPLRLGADDLQGIHWGIVGGESGPGARPMAAAWVDDLQADLAAAGVAFFFKQTGAVLARALGLTHTKGEEPAEWPAHWQVQDVPTPATP